MKVVVTGIAGRLGSIIAGKLVEAGHSVTGIDMRPWPERPEGVEVVEVDLRKRAAEDVFREVAPEAVVHMPSVAHLHAPSGEAHRLSLGGTKAAIDYCDRYGVKQAVFVGRHTYYGATPDAPLYHTEDEPPMASDEFPELLDLIAADLFAGSALWRYSSFKTCILRLCYTLGPSKSGTLGDYLHGPKVPTVLGFDPLFQFMHEEDAARAVAFAIARELKGVYNVSGPNPLPLSVLIEEAGRERTPIPESMFSFLLGKFGLPKLPRGAVSHLKYPIVIDSRAFRQASGFEHVHDEYDTLRDYCAVDWEERHPEESAPPVQDVAGASGDAEGPSEEPAGASGTASAGDTGAADSD